MKTFVEAGAGLFASPGVIEADVKKRHSVVRVGVQESLIERFYAISVERKLKHPAVMRISEAARDGLFAGAGRNG